MPEVVGYARRERSLGTGFADRFGLVSRGLTVAGEDPQTHSATTPPTARDVRRPSDNTDRERLDVRRMGLGHLRQLVHTGLKPRVERHLDELRHVTDSLGERA